MLIHGFDQGGNLLVRDRDEAVRFYQAVFGMEYVYHHMEMKLQINGKFFFNLKEVSQEQYDAYLKAISTTHPILNSWVEYSTEKEARKTYEALAAEAIFAEELRPLPWTPCSAMVTDKFGVSWYVSVSGHRPCSDCKKPDCEGDFTSRCRLPKWTEELYRQHGDKWHKYT